MIWNWQQQDWPNFIYEPGNFAYLEQRLLHSAGIFVGILKHVDPLDQQELTVNFLSDEALKTSEIEGELLNRESLQSSIRRHFGLSTDGRRAIPPKEQGVAEMMLSLHHTWHAPLTGELLCDWHRMVMAGHWHIDEIGRYRSHGDPMQVVSGYAGREKVHFEAPPARVVPGEMERFISWFNQSAPDGKRPLPALIRASIAHLYFVCIHPFADGNGRIGRAVAEKALSQCLGGPTLIALSHQIQGERKRYYQALEANNRELHINNWIDYFSTTILAAQDYSRQCVEFLIEKSKLYGRLKGQLNPRQEKVITRLFRAGVEGFTGGLSAENYIRITGASRATATRDLHDLVEKQALYRTGRLKHTRYYLNIGRRADV